VIEGRSNQKRNPGRKEEAVGVLGGREKRNRFVEFVCSLQEGQQQPQQAGPRPTNSLGETKSFRLSCSLPTKLFPGATCNDEVRGFTTVGHSWCGVRICTRGYDLQVRYHRCTPNLKRYSMVPSIPGISTNNPSIA